LRVFCAFCGYLFPSFCRPARLALDLRAVSAGKAKRRDAQQPLQEGIDYYFDASTGLLVFTSVYLSRRGYCCGNGCRHCPYPKEEKEK
jgi:hypothetical protein